MLTIAVDEQPGWSTFGVKILLQQLGITFSKAVADFEPDVLITADPGSRLPARRRILLMPPADPPARHVGPGTIEMGELAGYLPRNTHLPKDWRRMEPVASFQTGEPAIARRGADLLVLADLFGYVAETSTLRVYHDAFAATFSWDVFRRMLLGVLEQLAASLGEPLVRLWYFPSHVHRNSFSYSVDVDHMLSWHIVRSLPHLTRLRAFAERWLPPLLVKVLAVGASHGFFGERLFSSEHMSRSQALLGRLFKILGLRLPVGCYLASLNRLYASGIPITAFMRPSRYQKEESLNGCRYRASYTPENLSFLETGLHFGATVGPVHAKHGVVKGGNPYEEDVFREGIRSQIDCLRQDLGLSRFGSRLHHVFGFNQEMFHYLDQSRSILYDSSVFGTVGDRACRYSPVGGTLPYYPVLLADRNVAGPPGWSRCLEIPVTTYETDAIPFDLLREHSAAIVISEHPDRVRSPIAGRALAEYRKRRSEWWLVDLAGLACWWKMRGAIRLKHEAGRLRLAGGVPAGTRVCLVAAPAGAEVLPSEELRVISRARRGGRDYLDVVVECPLKEDL